MEYGDTGINRDDNIVGVGEKLEDAEDEREKNWGRPKYRQPGHVDNVSHEQKLGGCLASDTGEHIWRPMESPPVNLGREIMGVEMFLCISGANRCTRNCTAQNCAESVSSYFRPKCLVTFHHD